jgi:hypothetical protein
MVSGESRMGKPDRVAVVGSGMTFEDLEAWKFARVSVEMAYRVTRQDEIRRDLSDSVRFAESKS